MRVRHEENIPGVEMRRTVLGGQRAAGDSREGVREDVEGVLYAKSIRSSRYLFARLSVRSTTARLSRDEPHQEVCTAMRSEMQCK